MCQERFRDGGSVLSSWTEPEVLVVCPRCGQRAVVRRADAGSAARRLTCPQCGLSKDMPGDSSAWGRAVDPWFGEELWLRAEFRAHTVWAFNVDHLTVLRDYVAAELRERTPTSGAAMSMLEKLPDWMTSAKHRDALLAVLDRLTSRA